MEMEEVAAPGCERAIVAREPSVGYLGIVVVHSTARGPAIGGVRWKRYRDESEALDDAMRLARGMTCKNALAGLPLGGGKSIIVQTGPPSDERVLPFHARAIEALAGAYVGGVDVGTSPETMRLLRRDTRYVHGLPGGAGDPSPLTARGVAAAMRVAVSRRWPGATLSGKRVMIQGCGAVGSALAELARAEGASVLVSDVDEPRARRVAARVDGVVVAPADALLAACDVLAPCALGGVLDDATVRGLRAAVIVGAANNQLAAARHGDELHARGVLYVPDFVANAGGVINGCVELLGWTREQVDRSVDAIAVTVGDVLDRAERTGVPPSRVAEAMVSERLGLPSA